VPERLMMSGRRVPRRRRRVFLLRRLLLVALVVLLGLLIWFLVELLQPFHGSGEGHVRVLIPKSAGVNQVANILSHDDVIDSSFFFKLRVSLAGDQHKLFAGGYDLKHGMSYGGVLKILSTPPPPRPVTNVTILPGRSRRQLDKLLRSQDVRGSYLHSSIRSKDLDPTHYGAPRNTPSLEGFLFPDTYQLYKPLSIPALVADQLTNFKQHFAKVDLNYAKSKHLTPYDVLIIGSLVQGESRLPGDGPKVASVIYNRLRDNMELGMDSTVAYATGNYTDDFTVRQLNSPSPWNTYNHRGLPPTPINSPSMQSIEAAAHPAHTNYLYFVNKVCGNGALAFTHSYRTFLTLSADWRTAVARAERRHRSAQYC
jgi:UPF0755 protein